MIVVIVNNSIGRATAIVIAFQISNTPYQLETVSFPEFSANKANVERFPLGQMPVLTLPDGRLVTQSLAISRYAGKLAGLYPEDFVDAMLVDEIIDTVAQIMNSTPQNANNDLKKTLREEWAAGSLQTFLAFFARKVGTGASYLVGGKLSLADIFLYAYIKSFRVGSVDFVPADVDSAFPVLGAYFDFIKADPVFAPFA